MPPGGDQLFTVKSIAREINMRNFASVTVVDPHSDVTPALIDRCVVVTARDCFKLTSGAIGLHYDAVIAPDAGAAKRASQVAQWLGVPMIQAWKYRDIKTGELTGFGIEPFNFASKCALIVDDICDGGGTFVGLAEVIKQAFPNCVLDLYTTHGYYTQGVLKLQKYFNRIISTDSVIKDYPLETLPTLPVCEKLLQGEIA